MLRRQAWEKIKVVLDVNVLVSALFYPQGKPRRVWQLVENEEISSLTGEQILDQLLEVITKPSQQVPGTGHNLNLLTSTIRINLPSSKNFSTPPNSYFFLRGSFFSNFN